MSITGSLLTYENNNDIVNKKLKKRCSILHSSQFNTSITSNNTTTSSSSTTSSSMGKTAPSSLNSSLSNSVITNASGGNHHPHQQQHHSHHPSSAASSHPNFQQSHLPAKYMNSKRKHAKYNNMMYSQMYPDHNNYLHLNSLWSIWYGVLLTLFQGYLAVHGAYRFLGCSLISWKIEPVAELNLQIILSGLVFILLPFFFTSAVFKVGNLANDGIKLATGAKERRCSMAPHDGLEEESRGGTLRTLWTHGGPTAAFVHIMIAMCLLLPRLLLESRIIENGLLPRETIWQTELDFMTVNRRNLVVLSVVASPYQNNTSFESQEDEDYFNDTMFTAYSSAGSANNLLDNNSKKQQNGGKDKNSLESGGAAADVVVTGKTKYFELPDLIDASDKQNSNKKWQGINPADTGTITTTMTTTITTITPPPTTTPTTFPVATTKTSFPDDDNKVNENNRKIFKEMEIEGKGGNSTFILEDVIKRTTASSSSSSLSSLPTTAKTTSMTYTTSPTVVETTTNMINTTPTNIFIPTTTDELTTDDDNNMASTKTITYSTDTATKDAALSSSTQLPNNNTPTTSMTTTTTPVITTSTESPSLTLLSSSSSSSSTKHDPHHVHHHHQQHHHNTHNGKSSRKHHRQRKVQRKNHHHQHHQQQHHHHHPNQQQQSLGSNTRRLEDVRLTNLGKSEESIEHSLDVNNLDEFEFPSTGGGGNVYEHRPTSYEELDYGRARAAIYPKSSTTISTTTRDSNIHIVKPEKLPEIIPSTPLSSNSKIIEIKTKSMKKIKREISLAEENHVEIEPEYLIGDLSLNDSSEYIAEINSAESSTSTTAIQPASAAAEDGIMRLDGFAGMLQLFFGIEKPLDVNVFIHPPSAEFVNLLFALLVWCVRYPAVFWTTAKSFATIFSVQMIAASADIVFSFVGISNLYKLQIFSEAQPIQNPGLILNASVTLALFLLSTILMLSSSMIMYLYGHGRLAAKMRDRSVITLKSSESWIYFAHCASLCYVLALAVVKAPLLNDLSATYRYNLHCPTFLAALVSVMHILLWIVIWLGLTVKRRWSFKLPPLDAYAIIGKATTQPLLMHNRGSLTNTTTASLNNSTVMGGVNNSSSVVGDSMDHKMNCENSGNHISNTTSSDIMSGAPAEDIYWPKLTPSSPKLKVTFNEVTSTSDDDHHHRPIGEHEQNDGKRNSPRGTTVCFTSTTGEIDDGEYATLRSATAATVVGIALGSGSGAANNANSSGNKGHTPTGGIKVLHLSEYDELPPPPPHMISSMTITNHTTTVTINPGGDYVNCIGSGGGIMMIGEDNISEEGKLLACVRDDSVTYASTRDLEPPLPPPPPPPPLLSNAGVARAANMQHNSSTAVGRAPQAMPEVMQLSSSPEHLVSPLAPVTVTVHTNEAHIASSSTPRCLRRADSGVPQEALTPRSDTTSTGTESTISPPERAPSESSSGVHSAEEREIEVVIRPRVASKPPVKPPQPAIQEEPYGRCTNMRMSSFAVGGNSNSATLPLQRSNAEQKFDYSQHCNTMPLPLNSQNHHQQQQQSAVYATSAHCMSQSQNASVSSFKTPLYANSGVAMQGYNGSQQQQQQQQQQIQQTRPPLPPPTHVTHTTLSNGVRYSNPNILRRLPYVKAGESPYGHLGLGSGHHTFSKIGYESTLVNSTIPEDRDSANYSMTSDQDCLYATANALH